MLTPFFAVSSNSTTRLRETGVGGIGRGLEGRELVLVGRFFAPWVRPGGVGPFVWCGESRFFVYLRLRLPPPSLLRLLLFLCLPTSPYTSLLLSLLILLS
jgi:hypothetical protein